MWVVSIILKLSVTSVYFFLTAGEVVYQVEVANYEEFLELVAESTSAPSCPCTKPPQALQQSVLNPEDFAFDPSPTSKSPAMLDYRATTLKVMPFLMEFSKYGEILSTFYQIYTFYIGAFQEVLFRSKYMRTPDYLVTREEMSSLMVDDMNRRVDAALSTVRLASLVTFQVQIQQEQAYQHALKIKTPITNETLQTLTWQQRSTTLPFGSSTASFEKICAGWEGLINQGLQPIFLEITQNTTSRLHAKLSWDALFATCGPKICTATSPEPALTTLLKVVSVASPIVGVYTALVGLAYQRLWEKHQAEIAAKVESDQDIADMETRFEKRLADMKTRFEKQLQQLRENPRANQAETTILPNTCP